MATGEPEVQEGSRPPATDATGPGDPGSNGISREAASTRLISTLRADRQEVDRLLRTMGTAARAGRGRGPRWERMARLLATHCHAEEDTLYRLMTRMPDSFDHAEVSIEEHDDILEQVARIDQLEPGDASFPARLAELHDAVRQHVDGEERELLPFVAQKFDPDELVRLTARYCRLKETHRTAIQKHGRNPPVFEGRYDVWTPDALYAVAQAHRIAGRGTMNRVELIQSITRSRR